MADVGGSTRRRRERCASCSRPSSVCLCEGIPETPLSTRGAVVVLQHPLERRRKLRTLQCVEQILENVHVLRGRNFPSGKNETFDRMVELGSQGKPIVVLYPGADVRPIQEVARHWCLHTPRTSTTAREGGRGQTRDKSTAVDHEGGLEQAEYVLVAIDGTWQHAREMFAAMKDRLLGEAKATRAQLRVDPLGTETGEEPVSRHILWSEPYKECITTLEAIARALRVLEGDDGASTCTWVMNFLQTLHDQQSKFDPGIHERSSHSWDHGVASGHRYRRQSLAS